MKMGIIDDEKEKLAKQHASLESDLQLAEDYVVGKFGAITAADISSGIDPSDGPGEPIITERSGESIKAYCPKCRQDWSDSPAARKKELLRILHGVEIHDYPDTRDIFNVLQFDNTERYGCQHGHFVVYARVRGDVEDRLKKEVWKLIKYRAKIRAAIKALEPASPPEDETIWGHI